MKSNAHDYLLFAIKLLLMLSILNAAYQELWHIMSTNIFLLILVFTPQILKESSQIIIPKEFEYALIALVIITAIFAKSFAPILFGISMGMISLMILFILYQNNQIKKNKFLILILPLSITVALGTFLELAKFAIKILILHQ